MADLGSNTPSEGALQQADRESTVVATTRPTSPSANSIREKDANNKPSENAVTVTRTISKTEIEGELEADADPREIEDESRLLTGRRLALVHAGFLMAVLLFALDQTIVSTALPVLASKFDALDQLTWVVSAYFCSSFFFPFSKKISAH
jgi:hypothetical protein